MKRTKINFLKITSSFLVMICVACLNCDMANAATVLKSSTKPETNNAARVAVRGNVASMRRTPVATRTSTATVSTTKTTVEQKKVSEPEPIPEPEPEIIENKSAQFGEFLSEISESDDGTLSEFAEQIRQQRTSADARDNVQYAKTMQMSSMKGGQNVCDMGLRTCMQKACGNDLLKCATDGDTLFGDKLNKCRRETTCTGREFQLFTTEIKADRDMNVRLSSYTSVIDCGNKYNACIQEKCGATFGKCLGKTAADRATRDCATIAKNCTQQDSGLAARFGNVIGRLRENAEIDIKSDESQMYKMRDAMRTSCERLGAMFDERSFDCVYTVNFFAGDDNQFPTASRKAYAGDSFTCMPEWFGVNVTTFKENAYRETRAQTAASSAMLGSGFGTAAGLISSGAISRALDTQEAKKALKEECAAQGGKLNKKNECEPDAKACAKIGGYLDQDGECILKKQETTTTNGDNEKSGQGTDNDISKTQETPSSTAELVKSFTKDDCDKAKQELTDTCKWRVLKGKCECDENALSRAMTAKNNCELGNPAGKWKNNTCQCPTGYDWADYAWNCIPEKENEDLAIEKEECKLWGKWNTEKNTCDCTDRTKVWNSTMCVAPKQQIIEKIATPSSAKQRNDNERSDEEIKACKKWLCENTIIVEETPTVKINLNVTPGTPWQPISDPASITSNWDVPVKSYGCNFDKNAFKFFPTETIEDHERDACEVKQKLEKLQQEKAKASETKKVQPKATDSTQTDELIALLNERAKQSCTDMKDDTVVVPPAQYGTSKKQKPNTKSLWDAFDKWQTNCQITCKGKVVPNGDIYECQINDKKDEKNIKKQTAPTSQPTDATSASNNLDMNQKITDREPKLSSATNYSDIKGKYINSCYYNTQEQGIYWSRKSSLSEFVQEQCERLANDQNTWVLLSSDNKYVKGTSKCVDGNYDYDSDNNVPNAVDQAKIQNATYSNNISFDVSCFCKLDKANANWVWRYSGGSQCYKNCNRVCAEYQEESLEALFGIKKINNPPVTQNNPVAAYDANVVTPVATNTKKQTAPTSEPTDTTSVSNNSDMNQKIAEIKQAVSQGVKCNSTIIISHSKYGDPQDQKSGSATLWKEFDLWSKSCTKNCPANADGKPVSISNGDVWTCKIYPDVMNNSKNTQPSSKSANRQPNKTEQACINNIKENLDYVYLTCYPPFKGRETITIISLNNRRAFRADDGTLVAQVDNVPKNQIYRYYFNQCEPHEQYDSTYQNEPGHWGVGLVVRKTGEFIYADDIPNLPSYVIPLLGAQQDQYIINSVNYKLNSAELDTVCQTWNKIDSFIKNSDKKKR